MKLLIDAQLPYRLAEWLRERGHDVQHTLDLPAGNRTTDGEICALAERDERIVVTKDDDFVQSHVLQGRPPRLLLVATGNIGNRELISLWQAHLDQIETGFAISDFVEITRSALVIHG